MVRDVVGGALRRGWCISWSAVMGGTASLSTSNRRLSTSLTELLLLLLLPGGKKYHCYTVIYVLVNLQSTGMINLQKFDLI